MLLTVLPARLGNRMPDAAERAVLGPMITRLVERRRGHDLLPRRRRRAVPAREGGGHEELLRRRLLGERPLQRRGPGAALQPASTGWSRRARAPTRAGSCPRSSPTSAGASRATPARRASGRSSRAAGAAPGWASSCTRRRCSSARGTRFSMAVLTDGNPSHEYGTETLRGVARRRIFATARAARARGRRRDEPVLGGTPAPAAPGSWTCTPTRPSIRVDLSYRTKHNQTGRPLPGYCENWALLHDRGRLQPRPGAALPAPARTAASWSSTPTARCARPRRSCAGRERSGRGDARGHLHRAPQPPQHRQRGGPHARARPRRASACGWARLRPPRPERAHLQRERPGPAQPAGAEERDGALRLQRLLARVVALRAPRAGPNRYLDLTLGCPVAIIETWRSAPTPARGARPDQPHRRRHPRATPPRSPTRSPARASEGAALVVFPELALTGYPPEDLLLKTSFLDAARTRARELAAETQGIVARGRLPGARRGRLQRGGGARRRRGRGRSTARCTCPTTASSTSSATSSPAPRRAIFEVNGVPDRDHRLRGHLGAGAAGDERGAGGRAGDREPVRLAVPRAATAPAASGCSSSARVDYLAAVVFVNTVGGQDELVFDGHSLAIDQDGARARPRAAVRGVAHALHDRPARGRRGAPARHAPPRQRAPPAQRRRAIAEPPVFTLAHAGRREPVAEPAVGGERGADCSAREAEVYAALRTGLRDYVEKNGFERVVLGALGRDRLRAGRADRRRRARPRARHVRLDALPLLRARARARTPRAIAENLGADFRELVDRGGDGGLRRAAGRGRSRAASPTSPRRTSRRASAATW